MRYWTTAEDAALRAACAGDGMSTAMATIPDRSRVSIEIRARRMGLTFPEVKRRWTEAENALLRDLWSGSDLDLTQISARLRRRPGGVYRHAVEIGLPSGCPDGWEPISAAARRTGFAEVTLRKILAADGVAPRPALCDPLTRRRAVTCRRQIVAPAQVDAAIAAWSEAESVTRAAVRLGLWEKTLRAWLRHAGVKEPKRRGRPGVFGRVGKTGRIRSLVWRVTDIDIARALAWGKLHRPGTIARAPMALQAVAA